MTTANFPVNGRRGRWLAVAAALIGLGVVAGCETTDGEALGAVLGDVLGSAAGDEAGAGLSTLEIEAGLREALTLGTERVASQLGQTDGYFADPDIKIPLPGRLGDLQSGLSRVGLSAPLDDLELKLNRAAEAAVPDGKRLVIAAVKEITLEDAVGILKGEDNAATEFLRAKTETGLEQALTPFMDQALTSSGAFSALETVANNNGLGAVATDLKTDLTETAVDRGLDGLFFYLSSEEKKIRENPVARTTDLLKKVFGSQA
ncbi:MAG: DUF4197 domain-containing protein [Pseudomonadota bacterium]